MSRRFISIATSPRLGPVKPFSFFLFVNSRSMMKSTECCLHISEICRFAQLESVNFSFSVSHEIVVCRVPGSSWKVVRISGTTFDSKTFLSQIRMTRLCNAKQTHQADVIELSTTQTTIDVRFVLPSDKFSEIQ